jgi:hypothetical protein
MVMGHVAYFARVGYVCRHVKGGNQELLDARGGKVVAGALGVGSVCCQCDASMSSTHPTHSWHHDNDKGRDDAGM